MTSPYIQDIQSGARRLLTLMNRTPMDYSSGSCDRKYWHFKTNDFSSSTAQMSVGVLAKLWEREGTNLYRSKAVIYWIELGIGFLSKIQHRDGSFDEWYVNERGWAGPTGYLMNSCLDCYEIVSEELTKEARENLELIIEKGIRFLQESTEGHVIINHVAIVLLPLIQAKVLFNRRDLNKSIKSLKSILKEHWNEKEGWSLEYDGADPGYQSGTISFLVKSLRYENDDEINLLCERSLEFVSHFVYPSGETGGAIGTRHTVTLFNAAIEFYRDRPLGARLSSFVEESFRNGSQVLCSDLDDHYLIYRLVEFLDADYYYKKNMKSQTEAKLPYEQNDFEKYFESANIIVKKTSSYYFVCSIARGGVYRLESLRKTGGIVIDCGALAKSNKRVYSSLDIGEYSSSFKDHRVVVGGTLSDVTTKVFTPLKLILFRLFMIVVGRNYKVATWIKKVIKKHLVFSRKKSKISFERKIELGKDRIVVKTSFNSSEKIDLIQIGGEFWTRYVPQSRHFQLGQLKNSLPYFKEKNTFTDEVQREYTEF